MADKKSVPLEQLKAARDIVSKYQTGDFRKLLGKVPENEKKVIEQALEDIKDKDLKNNYWEWAGYITDSDNSPTPAEEKPDYEVVNDFAIDAIKDNFTPPGAKSQKEKAKEEIDTNDNGEIEVDEMADFQKSLDDYAAKNKKGRDDIPATYKR